MSAEITHGDLLPCPCGEGLPDVTHLFDDALYVITCTCGAECADWTEVDAVGNWNFHVRAYEATA